MNSPIEFETQRLLLRQWRAADRRPFAALSADPIVMAHFPAPLTREESDAIADRCERLIAERRWGAWATELKATGEFIGFVGLHIPQDDLPVSPCVEILWRLARAHWRQGFATEAAQGALHIGFEVLKLPEIVSFTVPSNTRSRAVMERLGMQMDAATFEHPSVPYGHALRTHCNYRLSRDRWLSSKLGRNAGSPSTCHDGFHQPQGAAWQGTMPVKVEAILFDLGNTLVSYYKATDFFPVLERSIAAVARLLQTNGRSVNPNLMLERAKSFNSERPDLRVLPLKSRLNDIFATAGETLSDELLGAMSEQFLDPIFATGKVNPEAVPVLRHIRALGLKSAIVSNTPWGSPAAPWRQELQRRGLLELVDEAIFCVDVGWRKPAPQIFEHTLTRLSVAAGHAIFVGDDVRWDVEGARAVGMTPVLLSESLSDTDDCRIIQRLADLIPMLQR